MLAMVGLTNHYRDSGSADRTARQEWQKPKIIAERPATKSDSEIQNERAERDLHAQEQMAKWAFLLFWATVAGVALLFATLRETYKAGQSAAEIFRETKRQANLAEEANQILRESSIADKRAWISISNPFQETSLRTEQNSNAVATIAFGVENVGHSPALNCIGHAHLIAYPGTINLMKEMAAFNDRIREAGRNQHGVALFPSRKKAFAHVVAVPRADADRLAYNRREKRCLPVILFVGVSYSLAGDPTIRVTSEAHMVTGLELNPENFGPGHFPSDLNESHAD